MPIDYSQLGYKEMFANYGLTALAAQALEKTVLLLLAGVECLEMSQISEVDLHDALDKHDRETLGRLIRALRDKVAFPQALETDLQTALERRNYVMHDFFLLRFDSRRLSESPEKLSEELRPIRDLFDDVQNRVDTIIATIQHQVGVSEAKLDEDAKRLLKRFRSPATAW